MIVAVLASAGAYVYLINDSVFAVAARRDKEEKISQIGGNVSMLEADYLSRANNVTMALALSEGFVDATNKESFATKDRPVGFAGN